jgi:hypothetical protein
MAGPAKDTFGKEPPQSVKQQELSTKLAGKSQGVIKQTSDDNCGPAAALIAAGGKANPGASNAVKMAALEKAFTNGTGTTAQDMGQMLAAQGMAVEKAAFKQDQGTVDQTLAKGGKLVAMVDSNQINPTANKAEAGAAHWVVVDGKDSQGNYTVKDPGTGTAYNVNFDTLSSAVDEAFLHDQGGGMLLVDDVKGGIGTRMALARQNVALTAPLPDGPGTGSRGGMSTLGRESA